MWFTCRHRLELLLKDKMKGCQDAVTMKALLFQPPWEHNRTQQCHFLSNMGWEWVVRLSDEKLHQDSTLTPWCQLVCCSMNIHDLVESKFNFWGKVVSTTIKKCTRYWYITDTCAGSSVIIDVYARLLTQQMNKGQIPWAYSWVLQHYFTTRK